LDVDDGVACHVCLGAVWVSMQTVEVGAYVVALCDVFWCLWFIAVSHFSVLDNRFGKDGLEVTHRHQVFLVVLIDC
jgi:predicted transporter